MTEENTILLIEKRSSNTPTFAAALKRKGYNLEVVQTGGQALEQASVMKPVLVILNAASLGSSGIRICRHLREEVGKPIIHIIDEDVDPLAPQDRNSDILLKLPFTARKLVNRIKRLMPADRKDTIENGHITFVKSIRVVRIPGRETRLTPKAADLLALFLSHPGKTLDRGFLMRQVWKTDYVGDTRTLDVHVRWVRQAIEPEPASPRYIRTVRGVGYCFQPESTGAKGRKKTRRARKSTGKKAKAGEKAPAETRKPVKPVVDEKDKQPAPDGIEEVKLPAPETIEAAARAEPAVEPKPDAEVEAGQDGSSAAAEPAKAAADAGQQNAPRSANPPAVNGTAKGQARPETEPADAVPEKRDQEGGELSPGKQKDEKEPDPGA